MHILWVVGLDVYSTFTIRGQSHRFNHSHAGILCKGAVVSHRHHSVKVHLGAFFRHIQSNDLVNFAVCKQTACHPLHTLWGGSLTHSNKNCAVSNNQDVSAFDSGRAGFVSVAPLLDRRILESGQEVIDRFVVNRLATTRFLTHRVDRDTVVHPA